MRPIVRCFSSRLIGPRPQIWAQQSIGPTPLAAMTPGSMLDPGTVDAGFVPLVASVALLVAILWISMAFIDRQRKRRQEAVALRSRIADGLMLDRSLSGFLLTPTVRMPLWGRGSVIVELTGSVPRPALRQAAIDLALREVDSTGMACTLRDRIAVTQVRLGRAA